MSTTAVLIVCVSALILAGMVLNAIPEWIAARAAARRAAADLELASHPGAGGYPADVVERAIRGALLTQGAAAHGADEVAELVVDELERGLIFDGENWVAA